MTEHTDLLRKVINEAPIMVFAIDAEGLITLNEGAGLAAMDLLPGQAVGQSAFDLFCDHPQILNDIRQALAGNTFQTSAEYNQLRLNIQYTTSFDEQGSPTGITALVTDFGPLEAAQDGLGAKQAAMPGQEDLLAQIISNIPYSVFWKSRNLLLLGGNDNFVKDLGFKSPQELVGKSDYDLGVTREQAEFYRKCDLEVMERGEPMLNIEETQLQADGQEATLLTSKVPLKNTAGEVIGLLGIYTDITERKQAERLLQAQNELLSHILATIPHSVFWKDREGHFLGCNQNFIEDMGFESLEDIVGKTDDDLPSTKEQAEFFRKCDQEVMESNKPMLNIEEKNIRADGTEVTLLTSKVPLSNASGEVIGILGIYADITSRHSD